MAQEIMAIDPLWYTVQNALIRNEMLVTKDFLNKIKSRPAAVGARTIRSYPAAALRS